MLLVLLMLLERLIGVSGIDDVCNGGVIGFAGGVGIDDICNGGVIGFAGGGVENKSLPVCSAPEVCICCNCSATIFEIAMIMA